MSDHRWDGGDSSRIEALEARVVELEAERDQAQSRADGFQNAHAAERGAHGRTRMQVVELTAALRRIADAPAERVGFDLSGQEVFADPWQKGVAAAALAAAGEGEDRSEGYVSCICGKPYEAHEVRNGYCPTRGPLAKYEPDLSGSRLPEPEGDR